jgi:hypothetical protein
MVTDRGELAGGLGRALDMRGRGTETGCMVLTIAAISAVCVSESFANLLGLSNLSKSRSFYS